jgi:hypothetical protein
MNKEIAFDKLIEYKRSEYMFRFNSAKKCIEIKNTNTLNQTREHIIIQSNDLIKLLIEPFDEYNQFCENYSVNNQLSQFIKKYVFFHENNKIVIQCDKKSKFTKNLLFLFSLYKLILHEYIECQKEYVNKIDQKLFQYTMNQLKKFILLLGDHCLRLISNECQESMSISYKHFLLHFSSQIVFILHKFIPKQLKKINHKYKEVEEKHHKVSSDIKTVSNTIVSLENHLKNQMNMIQVLGSKIDNFKRDYIQYDMKTDEDVFVKDIKSLDSELTSIKYAQKISTIH